MVGLGQLPDQLMVGNQFPNCSVTYQKSEKLSTEVKYKETNVHVRFSILHIKLFLPMRQ